MKTNYEILLDKADECIRKAWKADDWNIKTFFYNASKGFKMKAMNLTTAEASSPAED